MAPKPTVLAISALLFGHSTPAPAADTEVGSFGPCRAAGRVTCVVDGDTFWYRGAKIRIADINTPELSHPGCAAEAALARRSTERLIALLNLGSREIDRYGRLLRTVNRGGTSLGATLEAEGLAEHWRGRRGNWCAR